MGVGSEIASHDRGVLALFGRGDDLREHRVAERHVLYIAVHDWRVGSILASGRACRSASPPLALAKEPEKNGRAFGLLGSSAAPTEEA